MVAEVMVLLAFVGGVVCGLVVCIGVIVALAILDDRRRLRYLRDGRW